MRKRAKDREAALMGVVTPEEEEEVEQVLRKVAAEFGMQEDPVHPIGALRWNTSPGEDGLIMVAMLRSSILPRINIVDTRERYGDGSVEVRTIVHESGWHAEEYDHPGPLTTMLLVGALLLRLPS